VAIKGLITSVSSFAKTTVNAFSNYVTDDRTQLTTMPCSARALGHEL